MAQYLKPITTRMQKEVALQRLAGKTHREIAMLLGVKPQAVKKRLARARRRVIAADPAMERYARALATEQKPVRLLTFSMFLNERV